MTAQNPAEVFGYVVGYTVVASPETTAERRFEVTTIEEVHDLLRRSDAQEWDGGVFLFTRLDTPAGIVEKGGINLKGCPLGEKWVLSPCTTCGAPTFWRRYEEPNRGSVPGVNWFILCRPCREAKDREDW